MSILTPEIAKKLIDEALAIADTNKAGKVTGYTKEGQPIDCGDTDCSMEFPSGTGKVLIVPRCLGSHIIFGSSNAAEQNQMATAYPDIFVNPTIFPPGVDFDLYLRYDVVKQMTDSAVDRSARKMKVGSSEKYR